MAHLGVKKFAKKFKTWKENILGYIMFEYGPKIQRFAKGASAERVRSGRPFLEPVFTGF